MPSPDAPLERLGPAGRPRPDHDHALPVGHVIDDQGRQPREHNSRKIIYVTPGPSSPRSPIVTCADTPSPPKSGRPVRGLARGKRYVACRRLTASRCRGHKPAAAGLNADRRVRGMTI